MRIFFCLCLMLALLSGAPALGRSVLSPRHTGMEPPDGPRESVLPGMTGHVDAYGNSLTDMRPEEKKPRHRPRPGAYGGPPKREGKAALPEAPGEKGKPVWNFR